MMYLPPACDCTKEITAAVLSDSGLIDPHSQLCLACQQKIADEMTKEVA